MKLKKSFITYIPFLVLLIATIMTAVYLWPQKADTSSLPEPSLKSLAEKHNLAIGNFAMTSLYNEKEYNDILTNQFDFVLADNTPNWKFTDYSLRPGENSYDFSKLDEVVSYAEQRKMPVEAHHFVWGEEKWLPDWLTKGNFSHEKVLQFMNDHIATVGAHYKGRVQQWTVVNEAFTRNQHRAGLRDWWADNTGGMGYIDQAFITARKADPNAKLILNDFNNESINTTSNLMYDYIKQAKARGVPIDGIGMQMHIDGSHPPDKDEVIANMKRFGDLGVVVYVTEFDVNLHDIPVDTTARYQIERKIYYEMARACIESGVCHSFAILGITDKETWYTYIGLDDADPLPFDRLYNPKPAYYGFREALAQQ